MLRDQGLAAEVSHLEDRLDEMKERLELWVLRAASEQIDPSASAGLLHLAQAAEEIGDAAQQMVWLVEQGEELHPILALALGEADEVVVRVPVGRGSAADGASLPSSGSRPRPASTCWPSAAAGATSTGPAGRRARCGRRAHRHRSRRGPALLAQLCGYGLIEDDETGEDELIRV